MALWQIMIDLIRLDLQYTVIYLLRNEMYVDY